MILGLEETLTSYDMGEGAGSVCMTMGGTGRVLTEPWERLSALPNCREKVCATVTEKKITVPSSDGPCTCVNPPGLSNTPEGSWC